MKANVELTSADICALVAGVLVGLWLLRKPGPPLLAYERPKPVSNVLSIEKERVSG